MVSQSIISEVDESTARLHLKSPRSLSGRSSHLTLVTKWSRSWMTYSHPLCSMSIGPPNLRYSYFKIWPWKSLVKAMRVVKGQGHIWPWKFKGQGHGQGQTHWSYLRPGVQSICLLFVSWQSDHFWLRYSKFHIWPWKSKVKVMAKVKSDGHIRGLKFNRYVRFSFRGDRVIFGWDIANFIFDLENSRSRSCPWSDGDIWCLEFNRYVCFSFRGKRTLKIQGQCHGQGQIRWSHLRPGVQSIWLLFVSWQSGHFLLRYSNFHIYSRSRSRRKSTKI